MKNGMSAPSGRPSAISSLAVRPACHRWFARHQRGGRVGRAAAQPAAHRQALVDRRRRRRAACGHGGARVGLQQAQRAHDQVLLFRHAGHVVDAADGAVVAQVEMQDVAVVDQLEHRLQQVVAVGAAADDVQEQVELGRRRAIVQRTYAPCSAPADRSRCGSPARRLLAVALRSASMRLGTGRAAFSSCQDDEAQAPAVVRDDACCWPARRRSACRRRRWHSPAASRAGPTPAATSPAPARSACRCRWPLRGALAGLRSAWPPAA